MAQPGMAQPTGRGRAVVVAASPGIVIAVVALCVGILLGAPLEGVAVAVVVGAGLFSLVWFGAASFLVAQLGGSYVQDDDLPRAANLIEGLCATMGLAVPAMVLLDEPFRGALTLGRNERTATVVLTTGLLRALDPVELEGVLAHELSHVKSGDMVTATMAAAVLLPVSPAFRAAPVVVRRLAGSGRELRADRSACSVTRYPPGLRDALVKMSAGPAPAPPSALASTGTGRVLTWSWTVVPELLAPTDNLGLLDAPATRVAALDEA